MKIHWKHNWKGDGFQDWGYNTKWFYKCECGARFSSFSRKPTEETTWFQFMILSLLIGLPVLTYILFNLK